MSNFNLKRNDTKDIIPYTIVDEEGNPIDLTGASVKFYMGDFKRIVAEGVATITDAENGEVEYKLTTEDTLYAGKFRAEFEVTFSDEDIKTFPSDGYLEVDLKPNVNIGKSPQFEEDVVLQISQIEVFKNQINTAVSGFEDTIAAFSDELDLVNTELDSKADKTALDTTNTDLTNVKGEIETARGDKANLGENINQIKSDLAQTYHQHLGQQYDYVDYLKDIAVADTDDMSLKIINGNIKQFTVYMKTTNDKCVSYNFQKGSYDDFVLLMGGRYGDVQPENAIVESKNYEEETGYFIKGSAPYYYTTQVDSSISAEFTGNKIEFVTYTTNQGGLWEFILDEGTGGERRIGVSVYSENPVANAKITLFEGLEDRKHTIKGVFKGQDPSNPVTTPRGWLYYGGTREQDTLRTFNSYSDAFSLANHSELLYSASNKEYAIEFRPYGSSDSFYFVPAHGTATAFNVVDTKVLINGKPIEWTTNLFYKGIKSVQVIQKIHAIHPDDPEPCLEVTTIHTFKDGVMNVSGRLKTLRKTETRYGYTAMLPYWTSFADKILTSLNNTYTPKTSGTYSQEYLLDSDKAYSFAVLNDTDSDLKNVALAMTIENPYKTFRIDDPNRGEPFSWIEHRDANMGKIYFQQINNHVFEVGEEYRFDFKIGIFEINDVSEYLL